MVQKSKVLKFLLSLFLIIVLGILFGGLFFLQGQINEIRQKLEQLSTTSTGDEITVSPEIDECGQVCKREIQETVSEAVSTISATIAPKEQQTMPTTESQKRITSLNLNGSFTTTNTDWTDITSTDVWINLEEEYGKDAYVDWEAFIKTGSSGSSVYVRLYDVTHNIGVSGSDLSSSSITSTRMSSQRLFLWRGHNLYRVQVKSLNGVSATFDSGRIKIVY